MKNRPPLDKGGLQGGSCSVYSTYIGPPPHPQPLSRAGERGADTLRTDARTVDPLISRHSPLVTRHLQILLPVLLLSKTTLAAEISVYPPTIQLQGPKATQVLLVNSGQRDITS